MTQDSSVVSRLRLTEYWHIWLWNPRCVKPKLNRNVVMQHVEWKTKINILAFLRDTNSNNLFLLYTKISGATTAGSGNSVFYDIAISQHFTGILKGARTKTCCNCFWTKADFRNIRCTHLTLKMTFVRCVMRSSTNKYALRWLVAEEGDEGNNTSDKSAIAS